MSHAEKGPSPGQPHEASHPGHAQQVDKSADLAQKYKDYENNKELVKDDNPYR